MTLYIIRGGTVAAYASAPARGSEDELRVSSAAELAGSGLSNSLLVAIWNRLPGVQRVSRFENRTVGLNRIWRALNASAGEGEPGRRPRRGRGRQNKSELVLDMVRGPNGATLKALMKATRWQAHTVRGFLSRKVSKSLGLPIDSFRRDGERVYAVPQPQHLAAE